MSVSRSARVQYYLGHLASMLIPDAVCRRKLPDLLKEAQDREDVQERVAYYCPNREPFQVSEETEPFRLRPWKGQSTYQLDLWESLRYFPRHLKVERIFGDNVINPPRPSIVKSRPISAEGSNGVLLKLNRIRHFQFVEDLIPFREKADRLVWRGNAAQPHRVAFLEKFFDHPLCDVGHYYHRPVENMPYKRPELRVAGQLRSKFVFALEGNDVATNLKWILSSNSLCVMPPPRFETWFMEGRLQPGVHYVQVKPDYSDLEENLTRYRQDPDAAEHIIRNANQWVAQFQDPHSETLAALSVLNRYFRLSGQI